MADSFNFDNKLSKTIREASWKSITNILSANKDVDFALIAGDLFERSYFTAKDFKRLFEIFEDFSKDIYYVAGNHDYIDNYSKIFLRNSPLNFHVFGSDALEMFEKNDLRVYGISYDDRSFSKKIDLNIKLDSNYFNILLIHGDLDRKASSYFNLDSKLIKKTAFDYVAMGHIHKRAKNSNIYYPGSLEPHDFSDIYDYGYIYYEDSKVDFVDSSILKFYDFKLNYEDFTNENDLLTFVNNKLNPDKTNILRLKITAERALDDKYIEKNLDAYYKELSIRDDLSFADIVKLYPNSLLSMYIDKFSNSDGEIENLARKLGIDAILRSKDDWNFYQRTLSIILREIWR